jgi:type IV pilus assembly protein PilB
MSTPNDPIPPKKPVPPGTKPVQPPARPTAPGTPGAKPPAPAANSGAGAAKPPAPRPPAAGGTPGAKPPVTGGKPAVPGAKPAVPAKPAPPGAKAPPPATAKPGAIRPAAPGAKPTAPGPKPPAPVIKKPAAKKEPKEAGGRRKIGQVMIDLGFIDEDQLWGILDEAKTNFQQTGQVAIARGLITEDQLLQALAEQFGMKTVNLEEVKPTPEALTLVPQNMADVYKVVPLSVKDKVLTIALGDPNNATAVDDLRNLLSIPEVIALLASPKAIAEALSKVYAGKEESIFDVLQEIEADPTLGIARRETSIDIGGLMEMTEAAPVRKLINMVFLMGIKDKASDIHFEPFEEEYKIRMRCDGVLYEMVPPPRHLANALASRIKVMSNLDIAERRVPQDGRIELNVGGNPVDMRVSILPTMFGESVVIRVLDRSVVSLDLNKVGMSPEMLTEFRRIIHKPNGIVLVTGPTGAGKTTTLYSALSELNEISDKIITTEDPVEYDIDGIVQCPINHDIGLTFAIALRAILRQDPDIILVGEIRDLETAQIAIQASLTGHMVFSTLHTNDAPSTITRLRDMGVEPFLITATLEAILAQRLVRKICEDCRTEFEPSAEMLMELNMRPKDVQGRKFFFGRGCDRCNNTGHRGRMGLFELIVINDDLRDMISAGASTDQLRLGCKKMGMTTLRESGMRALYAGLTTIEEVVRETILDEEAV